MTSPVISYISNSTSLRHLLDKNLGNTGNTSFISSNWTTSCCAPPLHLLHSSTGKPFNLPTYFLIPSLCCYMSIRRSMCSGTFIQSWLYLMLMQCEAHVIWSSSWMRPMLYKNLSETYLLCKCDCNPNWKDRTVNVTTVWYGMGCCGLTYS